MECPFVIGQKVVCLETWAPLLDLAVPQEGEVYTIREIEAFRLGIGLRFEELVNRPIPWAEGVGEVAWSHQYFRPAVDLLAEFLAARTRQKPRQKTKEKV